MLAETLRALTAMLLLPTLVTCVPQLGEDPGGQTKPSEPDQAGIVVVDGVELRWEVAGEGLPCMVIGNPTAYQRIFSDDFKKSLRCVYGDSRIFAPGPAPVEAPAAYTFEIAVADADEIRQAAGFEHVVVVGHSVHSLMALEYAKTYPDRVSHVVMLAMSPWCGGPKYEQIIAQYWSARASDGRQAAWERNQAMLTEEALAEVPATRIPVVRYLADTPKHWFDYSYDAAPIFEGIEYHNVQWLDHLFGQVTPDHDVTKGLENLGAPVFLALGVHDYLYPPGMWDDVRSVFPDLTLRLFEKSAHFPMLEEAERFDRELIAWLRAQR
jgi:proline iminopeptidase